jgi:predicted nucleotidyltransferase
MPQHFRDILVVLVVMNAVAIMAWERLVVLGPVGRTIRRMFPQTKPLIL